MNRERRHFSNCFQFDGFIHARRFVNGFHDLLILQAFFAGRKGCFVFQDALGEMVELQRELLDFFDAGRDFDLLLAVSVGPLHLQAFVFEGRV